MLTEATFGDLRLVGYSRSCEATVFYLPAFRLALDMGWCPVSLIAARTVAITHTHLDHINGLPMLAAHRDLRGMPPPRVYAPAEDVERLRALIAHYNDLDRARSRYTCDFVGVAPGDEVELDKRRRLRVLPAFHGMPALGYVLTERRRRLRPVFRGKPQEAIRAAATAGESVDEPVDHPLVCYLGDTDVRGLEANAAHLAADVVLVECTFLEDDERELAREKTHLHLADLVERASLFRCRHLVLTHFSLRHEAERILARVRDAQEAFPMPVHALVASTEGGADPDAPV